MKMNINEANQGKQGYKFGRKVEKNLVAIPEEVGRKLESVQECFDQQFQVKH